MPRAWRNRQPSFFWQGLLILLPVALLVGLGFISLRREKALALQEGTERAQTVANSLNRRIWEELARFDANATNLVKDTRNQLRGAD